jgi:hypothetical protein
MKNMAFDTLNKLTILEICNKLSFEDLKINVNSFDLFYDYNNHNNKTEKRKEKIIVLTKKKETKLSDSNNIKNYFFDVTYGIIPQIHKENKLLTISGYDNNTKMIYI